MDEFLLQKQKDYRNDPSKVEKKFIDEVIHKVNPKFEFQHIIDTYIVDFYCEELKLIIELDGPEHELTPEYEDDRTEVIGQMYGNKIIRFTNNEVLNNIESVRNKLVDVIESIQ